MGGGGGACFTEKQKESYILLPLLAHLELCFRLHLPWPVFRHLS